MRRRRYLIVLLIIVSLILVLAIKNVMRQRQDETLPPIIGQDGTLSPIIGGFSIDTPEQAVNAAGENVQVVFAYGEPPAQEGDLGRKLRSLNMKVVDGFISSYLEYYECSRTQMRKPTPTGFRQFCRNDAHPFVTDERTLLSLVTTHLQQVKDNQLIIGYWVLDDWPSWDIGSAKPLLIKIHQIIEHYTPGRFAICGFAGAIDQGNTYGWNDPVADNFSSQGCDRVGLYIYSGSQSNTVPHPSSDAYNWSMAGLLPQIFTSLKTRGWDITKEPLIGIGQAFGGPRKNTQAYWVTPNARNIEMQSRSFCEHGATGLVFYAWDDSGFGPGTQTPMNSPEIQTGIQRGIAACQAYWNNHSRM